LEIGYCFDCNELNYALTNKNGVYERANMSNNHVGHNQHVFGRPEKYCAPIKNVLTKLQATLPITHNEMILFKLAIDLGEIDQYKKHYGGITKRRLLEIVRGRDGISMHQLQEEIY